MTVWGTIKSGLPFGEPIPETGSMCRFLPTGNISSQSWSPSGDLPPAKVRIQRRGAYDVGVLDRSINEEALKKALDEFA
jgi:hypothetical protein